MFVVFWFRQEIRSSPLFFFLLVGATTLCVSYDSNKTAQTTPCVLPLQSQKFNKESTGKRKQSFDCGCSNHS